VCPEEKRMSGPKFCGGALPIDVLRFIFRFLRSKEIVTLDNAMTNRNDREFFLLALSGTSQMIFFSSTKEKFESQVRWCLSRGIIFRFLNIEHDHPPYLSQLILRNAQRIRYVKLFGVPKLSSQLTGAICQCSNLHELQFMGCHIPDPEMNLCFRELTKLHRLSFYSAPRLTAASIRSLVQHCPRLEWLTFSNVLCVSDNELREILEGLPHLRSLFLTNVNITDRSMTLIAQTNAINENYEIVQWDNCPRVTWDGKLSYLRQLHLPQLFSHNQMLQLSGLKGFAKVIPFRSQFPIEQFISMGFFIRTQEIISSIDQSRDWEFIFSSLNMFTRLIESGCTSRLMEIGFVDFMMRGIDLSSSDRSCEWLDCFVKISQIRIHRQLLISRGILPKLRTIRLVRKIPSPHLMIISPSLPLFFLCRLFAVATKPSTSKSSNSLPSSPPKWIGTVLPLMRTGFK
jgi:hypothetical protein